MSRKLWRQVLGQGLKTVSKTLNGQQHKVFGHLTDCGTDALGESVYACFDCGYTLKVFCSCRDRHCPCCQYAATKKWCEAKRADILPVTYFHLVFTLPSKLNGWVSCHGRVIYQQLFASAWHTLNKFGHDPKRLDGQMGMLSVLHTWGQTLVRHVHLHCMLPGGALGADGEWHRAKSNYLFPVRALSRHFRGRMVAGLRRARKAGDLARIDEVEFNQTLDSLMRVDWVVYNKPASYGHDKLINYLGRYTRRIALSPHRVVAFDGEQVSLSYRDYRDGNKKLLHLSAVELIRRFALHILPSGFMRVRQYGFLANAIREKRLKVIRKSLKVAEKAETLTDKDASETDEYSPVCPKCQSEQWHYIRSTKLPRWEPG